MPPTVPARYALIPALCLGACNIDTLTEEFLEKYGPQESSSTGSTGGTGSTGDSSSGGPGGSGSSAGAVADTTQSSEGAEASVGGSSGGAAMTSGEASGASDGESTEAGPRPSVCGDGIVEGAEECDDGNSDETDQCSAECLQIRLIFSLSLLLQGDMNGLQGANAYCRSQALKAMQADPESRITAPERFAALLPTNTQTVFELHPGGAGPYQLVNGQRVADSFAELFEEPLQHPINLNEFGQLQPWGAWTGMGPGGISFPGIDFCGDWKSNKGSATWGNPDAVDGWWLYLDVAVNNPTDGCIDTLSLYCIEEVGP